MLKFLWSNVCREAPEASARESPPGLEVVHDGEFPDVEYVKNIISSLVQVFLHYIDLLFYQNLPGISLS